QIWRELPPTQWNADARRFFDGLRRLDALIAGGAPIAGGALRLFQGPIADALTHTGQIALLRGLAGAPLGPRHYYVAEVHDDRLHVGAHVRGYARRPVRSARPPSP